MKNKSIWTINVNKNYTNKLNKDISCDILIIGGGIAGITCAYFLKDSKKDVVLIDKDACGYGITSKTTGKLTFLQGSIYDKLRSNFNNDIAISYLNSQKDAIKIVKDIINKNKIDCDLTKTSSYLFTTGDDLELIKKEQDFFDDNNIEYEIVDKLPINYKCNYAIKVDDGYVFHPIKYVNALKKIVIENKIKIYEKTIATNFEKENDYYIVSTKDNKIIAKKVIICTHYPFFIKPFFLPFKSCIEKSYVLTSSTCDNKNFQAITDDKPIYSIRYHTDNNKNYIIFAGNSHKSANYIDSNKKYEELILEFKKNFDSKIDYYFSNHDIMTFDNLAYIGRVNDNDNTILLATGFNKWGMTNGSLAGLILSDIVLGKKNKYEELFNPKRSISKDKVINLVVFNFITSTRLILTKFKKNYKFYKAKIKITDLNGKKVGIYIDDNNIKHVVSNTCPHMKCSLIFNTKDKTWDCPCHGSRFDIDGNIITGPSVYNIKIDNDNI